MSSPFTNGGFEKGDLTSWGTGSTDYGDPNTIYATPNTASATYGTYGCELYAETAVSEWAQECSYYINQSIDLTDVDVLSFRFIIRQAALADTEKDVRTVKFVTYIEKSDPYDYHEMCLIEFNPDHPPSSEDYPLGSLWSEVNYDTSALSGVYEFRAAVYANDHNY